jgi:adenosylcobyric acid synthase
MFAYVAGTLALLNEEELACVRGVVVNRFRGDKERLLPGLQMLEERTGKPVVGVLPYLSDLSLPAEDSLGLQQPSVASGDLDVAVLRYPRISNFTDLHILSVEPGVQLRYVSGAAELGNPHVIILPGTKNTMADLAWLREKGLADMVTAAAEQGAFVVGICGGFQMLGTEISDPLGVDGAYGRTTGLGLLKAVTEFVPQKTTVRVRGKTMREGDLLEGYEIHLGRTRRQDAEPFARLQGEDGTEYEDGAVSTGGRVLGTYLHGLFDAASFRSAFLNRVRKAYSLPLSAAEGSSASAQREVSYVLLGNAVREHLDTAFLHSLIREQKRR